MNFYAKALAVAVSSAALFGCANNAHQPDPSAVAVEQFRMQMLDIGKQTNQNINNANKVTYSADARSDWVDYLDESDTLNMTLDLSYVGDRYSGSFQNLVNLVAEKTGYQVHDYLQDEKVLSKIVSLKADGITGLSALYIAYSRVDHEKIDFVIRPKEKILILRPECVDSYDCERMHDITAN